MRDTIAAIATQVGGAIGVVRISGPRAEELARRLVTGWPATRAQTHKLTLGTLRDPITGEALDEVLACVMRAPHSYTGEDVVELQGHGGPRVLARVLDAVLRAGARGAEPGEFTRRAFEAGRIDLSQAEAVAEVIAARTDRALRVAQTMLAGQVGKALRGLRQELVLQLAELEGPLDFPDEQLDAGDAVTQHAALTALVARLRALAQHHRRFGSERAEIVLVGRVNAGKSSLLNALAGEERALVDAEPGTTRDVVEHELMLGDHLARIADTAGEREVAQSTLEGRGVALGRQRRARADVAVLVVDGSHEEDAVDAELWATLPPARVAVWNKRDLPTWRPPSATFADAVPLSTLSGEGLSLLRERLAALLADGDEDSQQLQINARQREALLAAADELEVSAGLLGAREPAELAALHARGALHHLGLVTGETADPEILDAIFARFCIGK